MRQLNQNPAYTGYRLTDPAQLAVNRRGEFAPGQRLAIWAAVGMSGCVSLFIGVPLLLGSLVFGCTILASFVSWLAQALAGNVGRIEIAQVLGFVIIGAILFVALRALAPVMLWLARALLDLSIGRVAQVEGQVVWGGSDYQAETAVGRLHLGHSRMFHTAETLAAGAYRFYYLPRSRWVIGAEPLESRAGAEASGIELDTPAAEPQTPGVAPQVPAAQLGPDLQGILAQANGFSLADLAANRAGRLTASQAARLRAGARNSILFGILLLSIPFVVAALSLATPGQGNTVVAIMFSVGVFGLCGIWIMRNALKTLTSARGGQVAVVEGAVSKRSHWDQHTKRTDYYYSVANQQFRVSEAAFNALHEDRSYRLYYSPGSQTLLSIEPIEASA